MEETTDIQAVFELKKIEAYSEMFTIVYRSFEINIIVFQHIST